MPIPANQATLDNTGNLGNCLGRNPSRSEDLGHSSGPCVIPPHMKFLKRALHNFVVGRVKCRHSPSGVKGPPVLLCPRTCLHRTFGLDDRWLSSPRRRDEVLKNSLFAGVVVVVVFIVVGVTCCILLPR